MRRIDWVEAFLLIIVFVAVGLTCLLGLVAWNNSKSPTFELRKDEWRCASDRLVSYPQALPVGKTVVVVPRTKAECVRWDRIGWDG